MSLLHVDSSILGENSVSRLLSAEIVAAERQANPGMAVVYRDLAADPLQHLSGYHLAAGSGFVPEEPAHVQDLQSGAAALEEFLAADTVVVGAPMYNFTLPSQLKAWIDRLAIAGKTFRYSETGPIGLAGGKKVIIASSRGGFYGAGSPSADLDFQESYLRSVFGFMGITDIRFVRAEGVAIGPAQKTSAIAAAKAEIGQAIA
jgi:FMN-dependent NADH-azoreductase